MLKKITPTNSPTASVKAIHPERPLASDNVSHQLPACHDVQSTKYGSSTDSASRGIKRKRSPSPQSMRKSTAHPDIAEFLSSPVARARALNLSNCINESDIRESDIEPYIALEKKYASIFSNPEIHQVESSSPATFGILPDAEMDKAWVINTASQEYKAIGTTGLATCIAICAKGKNTSGETILGIFHSSGICPAEDVLASLHSDMKEKGAVDISMFLVGGMIMPTSEGGGSLENEAALLSHHENYAILGARLHLSKGECDKEGNLNGVNVVLTQEGVFYSRDELFTSATIDTESEIASDDDKVSESESDSETESESEHCSSDNEHADRLPNTPKNT